MTGAVLTLARSDRLDIGSVGLRTFVAIRRNLATFLLLSVICVFIPGVMTGAVNYKVNSTRMKSVNFFWDAFGRPPNLANIMSIDLLWLGLLTIVGGVCLQAVVVGVVAAEIEGRTVPPLTAAWRHILPLLGILTVIYIGCLVGLVLLVVPGVILALASSVSGPVRVVEGRGVFASIQRSRELTHGSRWKILLIMIVVVVAEYVVCGVVGVIKIVLHVPTEIWAISIGPATSTVVALVRMVGLAVIYAALRAAKEGGSASEVAAAFS